MVLNAVQQNTLEGYWAFIRSSLLASKDLNASVDFLELLGKVDPSGKAPLTSNQKKNLQRKKESLAQEDREEAQQLIDIFNHEQPQNRTTGDAHCGQEEGYACFYVDGFGSEVLREPLGILSLTSVNEPRAQKNPRNQASRDAYYSNPEAVSRRDVRRFLQAETGKLVADLRGRIIDEERSQARVDQDLAVAMKLDAEQLRGFLAKMQGLLDRERGEMKSVQKQCAKLEQKLRLKDNEQMQHHRNFQALKLAQQSLENLKKQGDEELRHAQAQLHAEQNEVRRLQKELEEQRHATQVQITQVRQEVQQGMFHASCIAGDPDRHPCFDIAFDLAAGRRKDPSLVTTMTVVCKTFLEQGAQMTPFGRSFQSIMPFPCCREAWTHAGSALAAFAFQQLEPLSHRYLPDHMKLPGFEAGKEEAILSVMGELWRSTCIGILTDSTPVLKPPLDTFVTFHSLLLYLAEENPRLQEHAISSSLEFLRSVEEKRPNPKSCTPDLGRFLVRFLLTGAIGPFSDYVGTIVKELFRRNMRWVDRRLWPVVISPEEVRATQVQASFEASRTGLKIIAFQTKYMARSAEFGLDTLSALEAVGGLPNKSQIDVFEDDIQSIKGMDSYKEFFECVQFESDLDVHQLLCKAVQESEELGYNAVMGTQFINESLTRGHGLHSDESVARNF
mmetsp:Transcript_96533/g.185363  ORF Transcript_96533/g.185363 Transcript_96533/m.185363 type:complete len:673 (-) Transcript_96533:19-2037(-)